MRFPFELGERGDAHIMREPSLFRVVLHRVESMGCSRSSPADLRTAGLAAMAEATRYRQRHKEKGGTEGEGEQAGLP